jgi:phosphoenolpyruvate-protein kinase (PTS system EI component)
MRGLPAVTSDGISVRLLCNASTADEVASGLEAGADGVGLLRTELAFLQAGRWPSEDEHHAALAPALALLEGRIATVRTFDFGSDKTPPFLVGESRRGLELALAFPDELFAQLRAIVSAGAGTRLRVLLPLVESGAQVRAVRALLDRGAAAAAVPALGAMIETPEGAHRAAEIAREADFLSIGTNDLVQYTLGLDRELPLGSTLTAAEPAVLRHVAAVGAAARRAGVTVEVCGEAAGEPQLAALFVGLGVGELSVSPARVDEIRAVVRSLDAADAASFARRALTAATGEAALELASRLLSGEIGDEPGEVLGDFGGAVA